MDRDRPPLYVGVEEQPVMNIYIEPLLGKKALVGTVHNRCWAIILQFIKAGGK